jgi:hypothetical protein
MKSLSVMVIVFCIAYSMSAQSKFATQLQEVTVFRQGAQIKRQVNVSLRSGRNDLILTAIPEGIDKSSIQIYTQAPTLINDISIKTDHTAAIEQNPEYKALQEQLDNQKIKLENESLVYETWKEEESLITGNKKVNGDESGLITAQLIATADLYRTRLIQVKQGALESQRKIILIQKEMEQIQNQINDWSTQNRANATSNIYVTVESDKAQTTPIYVSYYDSRAR